MKLPAFLRRWFIQPPADIVQAFNAVNSRMTYVYYKSLYWVEVSDYHKQKEYWEERRPPDLKPGYGNCVAFSKAYQKALSRGTLKPVLLAFQKEWHCVLDVQDKGNTWRLDCRKRMVELV